MITGCDKMSENIFCDAVEDHIFEKIGALIDMVLANQNLTDTEKERIQQLKAILEAEKYIEKVEIGIYTLPAQSELIITFNVKGNQQVKTLDILIYTPYKFRAFHD